MYSLKLPKAVFSGDMAVEQLRSLITEIAPERTAIITSDNLTSQELFKDVIRILEELKTEYTVIKDVPPEPNYMVVQEVINQFKKNNIDLIIGYGGGSVLDSAKLASVLKTDEYTVKDLLKDPLKGKKTVPMIAVPTTAGTGAETTPNAIVGVPEEQLKVGIVNPDLICDYIILDPRAIKDLPRNLAAATGIDALCHAIECYTSNKANLFSDTFALDALDKILNNIIPACDDSDALEEKNNMQIAAFYAGIAITASGTTAVHALSYPLGGKYHIAHGVSNAMLLIPVMEFNRPVIKERLALAYDRCYHGEVKMNSIDEKADYMISWMKNIVEHLDIPDNLTKFGVPVEDLETLVEAGMKVTRLLYNNMRTVTADDARELYRRILK